MVNTFFVDANPKVTAKALDDKRLGKQRVEAKQIIEVLEGKTSAWANHPAVKMWVGYTEALMDYFNIMVKEWVKRGMKNTMEFYELDEKPEYPPWCSCPKVWLSHQARLLQKDPTFYKEKFQVPKSALRLGYIWPSKWTMEQLEELEYTELAEEYKEEKICDATKKNGSPCSNKATYGTKCGVHKEKDFQHKKCAAKLKSGKPCSFKAKDGTDFCGRHTSSTQEE